MSSVIGFFRRLLGCLLGWEEEEARSTYQPIYPTCRCDYYSDCHKSTAQPLSDYKTPTRFEYSQTTTTRSTYQPTYPTCRYDNYSDCHKSTAQPLSDHKTPTRFVYSQTTIFPTSSSTLGSQSNAQATSTKQNNFSEIVQKPKEFSPSTLQPDSSFMKPRDYSSMPTLSQAPFDPTVDQKRANYFLVKKGTTSLTYKVPKDVEALIKKDILPTNLTMPLSPSMYKDFFHTMLYAEDWYIEKWNGFEMENLTLELEAASIYKKKDNDKNLIRTNSEEEGDKVFVAFKMDSVPQNRPFLLSRDFAFVRPSGSSIKPFQGIIYRVEKSNRVLVEFGENFHSQHYQGCKYDVKFSFNRICLKRAHQAIDSVSESLLKKFLFPTRDCSSKVNLLTSESRRTVGKLDRKQTMAVYQICRRHGPSPCLVEGSLCITETRRRSGTMSENKKLSRTGILIREAILRIYRSNPGARILLCSSTNVTCDELVKSLREEIPESSMFRANAAFREKDEVLLDILPSCRISGECFSCPSLKKFKVVSSTYMSCLRLHNEGLVAGNFSHLFMLHRRLLNWRRWWH